MATSREAKYRIDEVSGDIQDVIDRLEELSEDEEALSKRINEIIDVLSHACDMLDELE